MLRSCHKWKGNSAGKWKEVVRWFCTAWTVQWSAKCCHLFEDVGLCVQQCYLSCLCQESKYPVQRAYLIALATMFGTHHDSCRVLIFFPLSLCLRAFVFIIVPLSYSFPPMSLSITAHSWIIPSLSSWCIFISSTQYKKITKTVPFYVPHFPYNFPLSSQCLN